jgi:hypothetical protein
VKTSRLHQAGLNQSISKVVVEEFIKGVEFRRKISLSLLEIEYQGQGLTRRQLLSDINKGLVKVKPTPAQVKQSFLNIQRIEQTNSRFQHPRNAPFNSTVIQYVTRRDDRVRPTHRILDKRTYPRGHDFWINHLPPIDQGCRCTIRSIPRSKARISPDNRPGGEAFDAINTGVNGSLDYVQNSTIRLAEQYLAAGGSDDKIIENFTKSLNVLKFSKDRSLFIEELSRSSIDLTLIAGLTGLSLEKQTITSGAVNHAKDIYSQALLSPKSQNTDLALIGSLGYELFDITDGRAGSIRADLPVVAVNQIQRTGILEHTVIANSEGDTSLQVISQSITEYYSLQIIAAGAVVEIV